VDAEEFLGELGRCRPDWIVRQPTAAGKTRYLELQRRQWNHLKRNPSYLPQGASTVMTILHTEFGLNRTRQSARQQQIQSGGDIPTITTDASLSQAIANLQSSPGNWLQRWLKPRMIEERAAADRRRDAGQRRIGVVRERHHVAHVGHRAERLRRRPVRKPRPVPGGVRPGVVHRRDALARAGGWGGAGRERDGPPQRRRRPRTPPQPSVRPSGASLSR